MPITCPECKTVLENNKVESCYGCGAPFTMDINTATIEDLNYEKKKTQDLIDWFENLHSGLGNFPDIIKTKGNLKERALEIVKLILSNGIPNNLPHNNRPLSPRSEVKTNRKKIKPQ